MFLKLSNAVNNYLKSSQNSWKKHLEIFLFSKTAGSLPVILIRTTFLPALSRFYKTF